MASAEVDAKGKCQITFEYRESPPSTELRVLPAGIPLRASKSLALTKAVSFARYSETKQAYRAITDIVLPMKYMALWGQVTKAYHTLLEEERLKWQKVGMKAEDIAWIEEASKALEQEPIRLEFLEEALVA